MAEETFIFFTQLPIRVRPPPPEEETFFAINMGYKNTYLAVLHPKTQTPKLVQKFPTEVIITNQVDRQDIDPRDYFSGFIRLFGRKFDDPIVQKEKEKVLYKIIRGPKGDAWVETSYGKQCSISELLQRFLQKIQRAATSYHGGTKVDKFSITFPCRVLESQMDEIMVIGANRYDTFEGAIDVSLVAGMHWKDDRLRTWTYIADNMEGYHVLSCRD